MLPPLVLTMEQAHRFAMGQSVTASTEEDAVEVRVLDPHERLIGIGHMDADRSAVSPYKVFADPTTMAPDKASIPD